MSISRSPPSDTDQNLGSPPPPPRTVDQIHRWAVFPQKTAPFSHNVGCSQAAPLTRITVDFYSLKPMDPLTSNHSAASKACEHCLRIACQKTNGRDSTSTSSLPVAKAFRITGTEMADVHREDFLQAVAKFLGCHPASTGRVELRPFTFTIGGVVRCPIHFR